MNMQQQNTIKFLENTKEYKEIIPLIKDLNSIYLKNAKEALEKAKKEPNEENWKNACVSFREYFSPYLP